MVKENYGFWLMPEEGARRDLQYLIKGLALEYDAVVFEPHLTLNIVSTSELSDPEKALDTLVKRSKKLLLKHPKLTMGKLFTQSVYLRFNESQPLTALYDVSCEVLQVPSAPFYPHLSLIYKNLEEGLKAEMRRKIQVPLERVTFDAIRVMKSSASVETKADVENWQTICEKNLI